jgi:hypothetical protein
MAIDWDEAAVGLKRGVGEHGGFLTMQRDTLRDRFDIGRLTEGIARDLLATLYEHGLIVFPNPYEQGSFRVYDLESEIGKIALAVGYPEEVPETALIDAVNMHEHASAGKRRRSVCVPWLSAFEVFLQLVIGNPPDSWEELDDNREPYKHLAALAESLELRADIGDAATVRLAGAVWACRPRAHQWEGAPPALAAIFAEAARKQKYIYDGMLRDAAKYMLGGAEILLCDVDLGRLGLRYRHEAQGDI